MTQIRAATPLEEAPPPDMPSQAGPHGIRYDFNDGCRVDVPEAGWEWRVRLSDRDTGNVLYDGVLRAGRVMSSKRYFVRFSIEIWADGNEIFTHDYDAAGRPVLIQFPAGTLGDTVGWFSYAERFALQHRSTTTIAMREKFIPLFAPVYPGLNFVTAAEIVPQDYYATYRVMLYFGDAAHDHQPFDYQLIGLHEAAAYLLGVDPSEQRPRIAMPDPDPEGRPMAGPYVCIATQSTGQYKYWNNPDGWREVIAALRGAGYQVVCIDQQRLYGQGIVWNHIPNGVQDETGNRPLMERVRWLRHAEFFIGLSSGLSWLAWAVGIPVVLISGFTHQLTEFHTPYRVINHHVCNSCWNDIRLTVSHSDFLQCPRHKDTPRQFECTKLITSVQVLGAIRRIPAVAARLGRGA